VRPAKGCWKHCHAPEIAYTKSDWHTCQLTMHVSWKATTLHGAYIRKKEKKKKDSAGSDDTASMIKGGGYLGPRTRQPPTSQTVKKKLVWVRGVVCLLLSPLLEPSLLFFLLSVRSLLGAVAVTPPCAIAPRPNPWLLLLVLYCSAYLVFMSADACLMECSFSLCVSY